MQRLQIVCFVIWGGFSVNNATLNRFFALHFVLPFVLAALALMHLIALHDSAGSGNPLGVSGNYDRLPFAPYFIFKDLITIFLFIVVLSVFVFFMPNVLGDSENYVMANPMQTPPAIVPEWYLLPFYAILRSIPNKLLGVIAMFSAILILLVMPFTDLGRSRGLQFRPLSKIAFYAFVANFLILMQLGAKHVESPFIELGQISTVLYFSHFLIIVPVVSLIENSLIELHLGPYSLRESKKNNTEDLILCTFNLWLFVKEFSKIVLILLAIYLVARHMWPQHFYVYCADGLDEETRNYWMSRIVQINSNIDYHKDQVYYYETILGNDAHATPTPERIEAKTGYRESLTNLHSEERMLNYVKSKLNSGEPDIQPSSSLGKRKR